MDDVVYRRCRFVINENQRVLDACDALEKGDYATFGEKMNGSHDGLSKWYEVSWPGTRFSGGSRTPQQRRARRADDGRRLRRLHDQPGEGCRLCRLPGRSHRQIHAPLRQGTRIIEVNIPQERIRSDNDTNERKSPEAIASGLFRFRHTLKLQFHAGEHIGADRGTDCNGKSAGWPGYALRGISPDLFSKCYIRRRNIRRIAYPHESGPVRQTRSPRPYT